MIQSERFGRKRDPYPSEQISRAPKMLMRHDSEAAALAAVDDAERMPMSADAAPQTDVR